MTREVFHYAASLLYPPTLQRRAMSSVYPHPPVERSPPPWSPVPQSRERSVGPAPLPSRVQTLPVHRLQANLQRTDRDLVAMEHTATGVRKRNKKVAVHPCPEHLCVQDATRGEGALGATRGHQEVQA